MRVSFRKKGVKSGKIGVALLAAAVAVACVQFQIMKTLGPLRSRPPRCAINFWGLPRAFESLVLPSIVENVIKPNAKYQCDYFVHYYHLTEEDAGRSGQGGKLNPEEIFKLRPAVLSATPPLQMVKPQVSFTVTKEENFWKQYASLLEKIHNTKDDKGKYLYYPWRARTYKYPMTVDNIIKMWHSIQEAWNFMQSYADANNVKYERVAMLRSDVVYMSPIDIYQVKGLVKDLNNKIAVIPGFGKHPVNDRIIYGPPEAVKIWSTQRFSRLEKHVQDVLKHHAGWGMHSERFLDWTIFPAIRKETGVTIVEHDTICFFRARVDGSVWITDCQGRSDVSDPAIMKHLTARMSVEEAVEKLLHRKCGNVKKLTHTVKTIDCSISASVDNK